MPKYLIEVCGSPLDAAICNDSSRRAAASIAAEGLGGKLEAYYFAFEDVDVYCLCDLPDEASAVAVSRVLNQTEAADARIVPLMAPETFDAAGDKFPVFRAASLLR